MWLTWILRGLGTIALRFLGIGWLVKFVVGSFAVWLLPLAVKYIFMAWGSELIDYAMEKLAGFSGVQYSGLVIEFTGFVGYVAGQLRIVDCFSVMVSCAITMFFLGFVRK